MWPVMNYSAETTAIIGGCFKPGALYLSESDGKLRREHAGVQSLLARLTTCINMSLTC